MKVDHIDKLAIIIPFHKGRCYLSDCLQSIQGANKPNLVTTTYLIVNDGSNLHKDFPPSKLLIKIIYAKRNIGYSRSVNIGLYLAQLDKNDYYLILNQDTIVHANCLNEIISAAQHERLRHCIFSPVFLTEKSSVHDPQMHYQSLSQQFQEASFIEGAAYLMGRETLALLQYYDPLYHMYYEDSDVVYRLQKLGGKLIVVSKAAIYHYNSDQKNDRAQRAKKAVSIRTSAMISKLRFEGKFSVKEFCLGFLRDFLKSLLYADPELARLALKLYSRMIIYRRDIAVTDAEGIARRALMYIHDDLMSIYVPGSHNDSIKDLKALATNSESS